MFGHIEQEEKLKAKLAKKEKALTQIEMDVCVQDMGWFKGPASFKVNCATQNFYNQEVNAAYHMQDEICIMKIAKNYLKPSIICYI